MDWRMVGVSPAVSRLHLEPATFLYDVPSVLLGVYPKFDFIEYALESVIPFNQNHVPRGRWWFGFVEAFFPESAEGAVGVS
jgi:hypothetical protein